MHLHCSSFGIFKVDHVLFPTPIKIPYAALIRCWAFGDMLASRSVGVTNGLILFPYVQIYYPIHPNLTFNLSSRIWPLECLPHTHSPNCPSAWDVPFGSKVELQASASAALHPELTEERACRPQPKSHEQSVPAPGFTRGTVPCPLE